MKPAKPIAWRKRLPVQHEARFVPALRQIHKAAIATRVLGAAEARELHVQRISEELAEIRGLLEKMTLTTAVIRL